MTPGAPDSWRRFVVAAGVVYLALGLFVFRGVLAGETFFGGDVYKYFLPAWIEVTSQLRGGAIPVWNPNWSCGVPLLGGLAPSALYPPVIALAWLPPANGFALCVAVHPPFAALGFACFLRRQGVGALAAIVGGAAFGFSGFTLSLTSICPAALYVASWSGWLLLLLERLLSRPSAPRAAALSLAACMVPLAGEPQYALHLALLLGAWAVVRPATGARLPGLAWAGVAGVVTALVAATVLLPALEVMRYGERSATLGYAYTASWPVLPKQLVTLVAPFAYGSSLRDFPNPTSVLTPDAYPYLYTLYLGAIPLLAVLATPWVARGRLALFCALMALGFGLTSLGEGFGAHRALYECVPIYDRFRFPYKAWPGAALGLAGLAALGLDGLLRARARGTSAANRGVWVATGLSVALLLAVGPARGVLGAAGDALAAGQPRALGSLVAARLMVAALVLCGAALLGAFALSPRCPRRWGRVALGVVAVLELGWGIAPAVATAPVAQIQGEAPSADADEVPTRVHLTPFVARYGQIETFPSLPDYVGWASREALVANTARWRNWEHFRGCDKAFAPWHEQTFAMGEKLGGEQRVRLLAACGVELLVSNLQPNPGLLRKRDLGGGLHLSAVRQAFPRAFWVPELREVDTQAEAAQALFAGEVDLAQLALVPSAAALDTPTQAGSVGPPPAGLVPSELSGPRWSALPSACTIRARTPTEVRVDAPGQAGVLVLLDVWFPGWTVEVDGEERPLLRTNFAFRGVEVAAADREVVFRYRSRPLRQGLWLSGLGLLLLVVLGWGGRLRRRLAA